MIKEQINQEKQKEFLDKYHKLCKEYGIVLACSPYVKEDGGIAIYLGLSLINDKKI